MERNTKQTKKAKVSPAGVYPRKKSHGINIGRAKKGFHHTEEAKAKMSLSHQGLCTFDVTSKTWELKCIRQIGNQYGVGFQNARGHAYLPTPESNEARSKALLGTQNALGCRRTQSFKDRVSKLNIQRWKNPEYRQKQLKRLAKDRLKYFKRKEPTDIEYRLMDIIKDYQLPFFYNNYNPNPVEINNFIPDFVHKTKKLVILAHGDPWHQDQDREERALKTYEEAGYKVLTLWYYEIMDSEDDYLMFLIVHFMTRN